MGFDVPDRLVSKVTYTKQRLTHQGEIDEKTMLSFLTTKFTHWSYEDEYRSFLSLDKKVGGLFYADFSQNLQLKQVVVGAHSSVSRAQIRDAIGEKGVNVEIFKARAAFRSFKIVINRNDDLWG